MAFETNARRQAKVLFDELSERLLQDLAKAAREEAESAALQARREAETAGAEALAAARAEGEARLSAAQATNAGLLEKVEAARKGLEASKQEHEASKQQLEASKQQLEAAKQELKGAKTAAQADANRVREQKEALEKRITQLEQDRKDILKSRDEAASRHEAELRRAKDLGQRLEVETKRASELSESFEAETQRGNDLAARLEGELRRGSELSGRLEAEMRRGTELAERLKGETRRAGESDKALDVVRQDREAMIERVATALHCIDRASSPSEILETFLDPLARDFAIAAVFLVDASHVRGWQARGLESGADITKLVIPRAGDSPLARATAEQKRVLIAPATGRTATGIWGGPIARAVALPVLAAGRVVAVAYAEDAEAPHTSSFPGPGCRIVEILIEHASLRLTTKGHASTSSQPPAASEAGDEGREKAVTYSPARQARRLKKHDGLDLTVDGAESSLVDVSSSGAQILSPLAMRPNRVLRLMLRAGGRALACKGRVMWARFEQARGSAAAHYRVGVKFTDVDQKTVETFLSGEGIAAAR
jgi:hypothetical protein